ncbi:IS66 family transposase [Geminocystis sp. GBBB08]|uniref:IS66 family transposase n=1 Tax=Geminocystis sp. GBBB08 TaxID=2604140 RepID=UPI0027E2511C|nr:IS66 family transposase [Geminocystis sp. GBBB08]MBL1209369.1 IS66 family transposase [Geminocystis sp. GBBB08]
MEKVQLPETNYVTEEDWDLTPSRVKDLVVQQKLTIKKLQKELEELKKTQENLQEKVNCNSQNSSIPPSTELIKPDKKKTNHKKKRLRGGQSGHLGYSRPLYDESECTSIENHFPITCKCCGEGLSGKDESPYPHQIVEIPPIKLEIIEHRLHQLECNHCGEKTRAKLPESICESGYGATVVALVALMSGVYRHSHRMIVSAMDDFLGVKMALGTVNRLRKEASIALSETVLEAKSYIQSSEKVCGDETGFTQGNADNKNPTKKKAWLWVAVTPLVVFFQVLLSRSTQAAMDLLAENFEGILSSDRYGSYNWVSVEKRQICWAHLKREFQKISERSGVSGQIGRDLLAQEKKLFRQWRKVRDGTLSLQEFKIRILPIRNRLREILSSVAEYEIFSKEKTPLAKTVRTCRQLLKVEVALWLFVEIEGLEPTNNEAERAIRPAVLWKRTSFGSQSQEGSIFVGRMLTVVSSLRCQNRNVLEFMRETIKGSRERSQTPSLIPTQNSAHNSTNDESSLFVA